MYLCIIIFNWLTGVFYIGFSRYDFVHSYIQVLYFYYIKYLKMSCQLDFLDLIKISVNSLQDRVASFTNHLIWFSRMEQTLVPGWAGVFRELTKMSDYVSSFPDSFPTENSPLCRFSLLFIVIHKMKYRKLYGIVYTKWFEYLFILCRFVYLVENQYHCHVIVIAFDSI